MRKNVSVSLAAIILICLSSSAVWAWCWNRDTGKTNSGCIITRFQTDCCSGNLAKWNGNEMEYRISTSTSSSLHTYLDTGASRWNDVSMSTFQFTKGASTAVWDALYDGINVVNIDSDWCSHYPTYCGVGILGFSGCTTTGSGSSYQSVDCDVIFNGSDYTWGDGTGGTQDAVAVAAHELGHDLGLSHPGSTCRQSGSAGCGPEFEEATMYWNYSYGQPTDKGSLELDDVAGLIYGYPRSTWRVRVVNGGSGVSGASVTLQGCAAPVNGTGIATGGSVYGDVTNPAVLTGDDASSTTYVDSTPFSTTDSSGYTNYIYPTNSTCTVQVVSGVGSATQAVTVPAGTSTTTIDLSGAGSTPDILWRNSTSGGSGVWLMNGVTESSWSYIGNHGTSWDIRGIGDFNADTNNDVLWRNSSTGNYGVWLMNGTTESSWVYIGSNGADWDIKGVADFNNDGHEDIVWRNSSNGNFGIWLMNGTNQSSWQYVANHGTSWDIKGVGDFNADGNNDIAWRNSSNGNFGLWLMNGTTESSWQYVANHGTSWDAKGVGDFNADGQNDVVWRNSSGSHGVWYMNGASETSWNYIANHGASWDIKGAGDMN